MTGTDPTPPAISALELFCGIGGFAAAAVGTNLQVAAAMERSPEALATYRLNFPGHTVLQTDLDNIAASVLAAVGAEFWWLSPPCQPYSVRGEQRDVQDYRSKSLLRLLEILGELSCENLPRHLVLENVAGFLASEARLRLAATLTGRGFNLRERILCPTDLGVPSRRPRYYLTASRDRLAPESPPIPGSFRLSSYLDAAPDEGLDLPDEILRRFSPGLRILDPSLETPYTTCFTSSYGKTIMHAGSYLRHDNRVRRFSPEEILRLLHFPREFRFPEQLTLRRRWHLAGNSLSVMAVRHVLKDLPAVCLLN